MGSPFSFTLWNIDKYGKMFVDFLQKSKYEEGNYNEFTGSKGKA